MAEGEKGHLPKAETPQFHPFETGKGANISGGHKKWPSSPVRVDDSYAHKLRSIWSKALNAAKRFGNF